MVCAASRGDTVDNIEHQTINVNCDSRRDVIDILQRAWQTLREQRIGGSLEDMCWDSFKRAESFHPSLGMNPGLASSVLAPCNLALEYVETP